MSKPKTGFVLRIDRLTREWARIPPYFARRCGQTHTDKPRSVDATFFTTEEEAEGFGSLLSRSHLQNPVEEFTVLAETIHTLKVSGDERELIRLALVAGNTDQQRLAAALFKEASAND